MTKQDMAGWTLSSRAVTCKHWRWMPGMLAFDAGGNQHRVIEHDAGREYITTMLRDYNDAHCESSARAMDVTPDLADPATLGCLLHLVRQAQPDQGRWVMSSCCSAYGRWYTNPSRGGGRDYDTEAEALVAALEAAP